MIALNRVHSWTGNDNLLWWVDTSGDGGDLVAFKGEVDMSNATQFAEALGQFAHRWVTIDLSGLTFIDSQGLRVLLLARRSIERRHGQLTIRPPRNAVLRAFEIYGLDDVLVPDSYTRPSRSADLAPLARGAAKNRPEAAP